MHQIQAAPDAGCRSIAKRRIIQRLCLPDAPRQQSGSGPQKCLGCFCLVIHRWFVLRGGCLQTFQSLPGLTCGKRGLCRRQMGGGLTTSSMREAEPAPVLSVAPCLCGIRRLPHRQRMQGNRIQHRPLRRAAQRNLSGIGRDHHTFQGRPHAIPDALPPLRPPSTRHARGRNQQAATGCWIRQRYNPPRLPLREKHRSHFEQLRHARGRTGRGARPARRDTLQDPAIGQVRQQKLRVLWQMQPDQGGGIQHCDIQTGEKSPAARGVRQSRDRPICHHYEIRAGPERCHAGFCVKR
ncbi:hypothetical protein Amal_03668 [Acetobacter malorum]|uniref:Uncharacterized protein n=1 Tax=Acetobacter malorum TaxID=178901 RepID=A0A177G5R8_9PROT|nr:hypothetical protein Amal_03668 [Acetobacter malorum]